jgi:hypothetical protein
VKSTPTVRLLGAGVLEDLVARKTVSRTLVLPISMGLHVRMFRLRAIMSADLPTSMEPVSFSRKFALAPLIVKLSIICWTVTRSAGRNTSQGRRRAGRPSGGHGDE